MESQAKIEPVKSRKKLWITIIAAIILIAATVAVYYAFSKPTPAPISYPYKDRFGNTISKDPPSSFNNNLAPAGGQAPQYWENNKSIGALYGIKSPLAKAFQDYQNQLAAGGWTISNKKSSETLASLDAFNKSTGKSIEVRMDSLPGDFTSISIGILK